ncbi:MAG: 3-phosphoserine/phosphohydroxythreonine transaminase [Deltaproteobacteria bacterium]|nr:3-phosphoserine/phosphohydroxythreonine transaminase [Deltaproteobacteria bacterium]
MVHRIHNFNAGPAALPLAVLEEIQSEFLDFKNTGMSILEMSHRSKTYNDVIEEAQTRIKRLLGLSDQYHVLFIQGGASMQFCMVPMNLAVDNDAVDYVDTGTWSSKAIKEAKIVGKKVNVAASSSDRNYAYIPKHLGLNPGAAYVHITSNNTIKGTQWKTFPDTGAVPLVADMSSDILSRPIDIEPFGLIYAGAQKNMGPAGAAVVIIREDMAARSPEQLPTMLRYTTYVKEQSLYNTPPCFTIYVIQLVAKWLEETVGGLEKMEALNKQKADLLYDTIDETDFYRGTADVDSRSLMNVTFRLPSEDLEKQFVAEATENGLGGLKGHRSVGGCRASLYNATGLDDVKALVEFMRGFAARKG